ncbi:substrate-binding domain-containing protein [Agromyces seonyuensis]|uniref:DeoR family transcriptional regulator n=1 Tax=Agromyces seonyuensis TaxID=2662446 RepID=A0A6I4NYA1_9MICO|nr:substrate-binding domain-containing protein [Agromyces seonyuensis]MWB99350.1 DeoR family transcriptional regulator [Agromyces seonyuensis]
MTDQTQAPLAAERRAHVLAALSRDGIVRISQLIDDLGVAPVTLRRDLDQLEREGLLQRVHGGAVPAAGLEDESPAAAAVSTGSIAMLVPSLNYYWPGVVRGAEAEATRRGMDIVLRGASYELQDERPVLERLVETGNARGLIVAPNTDTAHAQDVVRWLAGTGMPAVLVERDALVLPEGTPMESVTTDHALGAVLAARHLAALGHRRVGLIISRDSPTSRKIAAGWQAACAELGLTPTDHFESILPPRSSPEFSAVVDSTLDTALAHDVTALVVHSDPEAMAFVDLALNRGISVPGDLSVVAYDDEVAELFTPALTAVGPPRGAVGAAAVDLIVRRLEDPSRPAHRVILSPTLNVRGSTAPPRDA